MRENETAISLLLDQTAPTLALIHYTIVGSHAEPPRFGMEDLVYPTRSRRSHRNRLGRLVENVLPLGGGGRPGLFGSDVTRDSETIQVKEFLDFWTASRTRFEEADHVLTAVRIEKTHSYVAFIGCNHTEPMEAVSIAQVIPQFAD